MRLTCANRYPAQPQWSNANLRYVYLCHIQSLAIDRVLPLLNRRG